MNPSTTTSFLTGKNIGQGLLDLAGEVTKQVYRMYFNLAKELLARYWLPILIFLIVAFIFALLKYVTTGRWSTLGSFLYHLFNLTTLFLIAFILGPEIFANDYFPIVLTLVYAVCFFLVGRILKRIGANGY